ncbi:hypothetical protein DPMN_097142 [Dreissena polymorpha]|uniref:Uncharacterized protein n=1 Tax=Dreissena polymorpha TaxID=45954 RepID=A0A9D4R5F9_DREPO|nr:hypothetical protein DPMN_097142 [Dreissena polymorpha]
MTLFCPDLTATIVFPCRLPCLENFRVSPTWYWTASDSMGKQWRYWTCNFQIL